MKLFEFFGTVLVKNEDAIKSLQKTEDKTQDLSNKFLGMISSSSGVGSSITNAFQKGSGALSSLGINIDAGVLAFGTFAVAGVAAAAAIIGKMNELADKTATFGNEIDKMSQKLGLSTDAYQRWGYVLGQADVEITSMQTGMKTLTNTIGDARNGSEKAINKFKTLGVTLDDLNKLSREEIFEKTIYGLQNVADETTKATLANDLFGKSGQELIPLLNETNDTTQKLMENADKYGLVMGEDLVNASAEFKDTQDTMNKSLNMISVELGAVFMPVIKGFYDWILESLPTIKSMFTKVFDRIKFVIEALSPSFEYLGKLILGLLVVWDKVFTGIETVTKPITDSIIYMINRIIDAVNTVTFGLLDLKKIGGESDAWMNKDSVVATDQIVYNDDGTSTEFSKYYVGENYNGGIIPDGYVGTVGERGTELLQNIGGKAVVTPLSNNTQQSSQGMNIIINADMNNIKEINQFIQMAEQAKMRSRMVGAN